MWFDGAPRGRGALVRAAAVAVLAIVLTSCAAVDPNLIGGAVADFHQRFNADEWGTIYEGADASFKSATPREKFVAAMVSLKANTGMFQKAEQRSYVVQAQAGDNAGTYVRVTYASTFSKKDAMETFAWRVDNARVVLFFYDAQ